MGLLDRTLSRSAHFVALAFLLLAARNAQAQVVTVDTSDDVVDFGGAQRVADLPGPDGKVSLPEAGLASDNTPGVQTIAFEIPQSEWLYQQFFPGRAVLKPFLGFRVFDTAILDARTQTAFTGETNPDGGGEVVIWAETYLIDNVGGAVYGFDHSSFHLSGGSGNVIQSNSVTGIEVYDSASNLIGGPNPGEGNTGGFIQIDRANGNLVVGNTVNRVRVLGWVGGGMPATGNRIGGPAPGERNFIVGLGTWSSEGYPGGFAVQIFDSIDTVIENNSIGTTPDGLEQGHLATTAGIMFEGENHGTLVRDNRIAGILGHGIGPHYDGWLVGTAIHVYGTGSDVSITGNTIGLNANGEPVLGSVTGITTTSYYLGPVQDVVIGGSTAGAGNEIAGHLLAGISVANTYDGVRIAGNSIHDNGSLGIDLITPSFASGVTSNDPLDADTGGNGLQNFPVLASATLEGTAIHVLGALHSSPLDDFTLEFFASPTCDGSGFGEGKVFLGAASASTGAGGDATFDVLLAALAPAGWSVTATATLEPIGSTSEFSACVDLVDGGAGDLGTSYCGPAVPNSSGNPAEIRATGSDVVADADFHLVAELLPPNQFGYFLTSKTQGFVANPGGSQGNLCLAGVIGRFVSQVQSSGAGGTFTIQVDLTKLPPPLNVPVLPGDTWNFQAWFRDKNPSTTSNFTDGVSVLFQ